MGASYSRSQLIQVTICYKGCIECNSVPNSEKKMVIALISLFEVFKIDNFILSIDQDCSKFARKGVEVRPGAKGVCVGGV